MVFKTLVVLANSIKREARCVAGREVVGVNGHYRIGGWILDAYKKEKGDWDVFASSFLRLLGERGVEKSIAREVMHEGCLLCSEQTAEHCHRRLVAEYLREKWGNVEITHIV